MKHMLFILSEGEFAEHVAAFSLEELRAYRESAWHQRDESGEPMSRLFYKLLACDLSAAIIERMAREGAELLRKLSQPPGR